jgi:hypothetical protein
MKYRWLLAGALAALVLVPAPVAAQTPASDARKEAVIRQLLDVLHAADLMVGAMEANVPAQRAASSAMGVPPVFWDRLLAAARARRGELLDALVPIYARAYELSELNALLAFYKSPIGQRVIELQPGLLQESTQAGQLWGERIGAAVGEQLAREGVQLLK